MRQGWTVTGGGQKSVRGAGMGPIVKGGEEKGEEGEVGGDGSGSGRNAEGRGRGRERTGRVRVWREI